MGTTFTIKINLKQNHVNKEVNWTIYGNKLSINEGKIRTMVKIR